MPRDVIVIGGGVIGCSIALKLAREGLKVTVMERGHIGCEASRAAAGMLSLQGEASGPSPFFDLCLRSRAMYRAFADELTEASGIDIEYKDEGTLFVLPDGEDDPRKTAWANWQLAAGLPLEQISADEIKEIEPAVTKSAARAVFLPDEHQIENRRLMDALEVAIKRAGVELLEGAEVTSLTTDNGRVTGVVSAGQRYDAGVVIAAAGAWSSQLLQPLGLRVEVIPARGQMIAVRGNSCPIRRVIHSSRVYVVPRQDGRILIGATVEYAGFRKAITVDAIEHLLSSAIELVPSLREFELIEAWCGLRPDTEDHAPVIGPSGIDNLLLATGHFRNGILLAPVTGELVAGLILKNHTSEELKTFSIGRFESRHTSQPPATMAPSAAQNPL